MEEKSSLLVVDDEKGPREALRMILKSRYDVTTAENAIRALEYIGSMSFDLAIVDIKMAGMDGLQLLREIKEARPDIEVILMTAYASVETAKSALQYGDL
ncbi:MAG: response regulator, partial [Nitrospira sp.]|nr:response regulator [Nitrospira sp.]